MSDRSQHESGGRRYGRRPVLRTLAGIGGVGVATGLASAGGERTSEPDGHDGTSNGGDRDGKTELYELTTELAPEDRGSRFGYSVAIDGDTAVVGGLLNKVYVFARFDNEWTQQAELEDRTTEPNDDLSFGASVALDGDTLLVGAPLESYQGEDETAFRAGAVYAYTRDGGEWTQEDELVADDPIDGGYFGQSVSLEGGTALVGAPASDVDLASDPGAAYVFTRSGGDWSLQNELTADDGEVFDFFGFAVSLDGDTALVGAPGDSEGEDPRRERPNLGSAYVFTDSGGEWTQQAKLEIEGGPEMEYFGSGRSVTLEDDTALVSAFGDVDGSDRVGYVFVRSDGEWTQQAKLAVDVGEREDLFTNSVALVGDVALLGGQKRISDRRSKGLVYVFERCDGEWQKRQTLSADGEVVRSVDADEGKALVGAPGQTAFPPVALGSAYVYDRRDSNEKSHS